MKNKVLTGLAILTGLMFLNSGLNKFFEYMPIEMSEEASRIIECFVASGWLWPLVAVTEIIGGILFAIPKTRPLGAIMLLPITVSILLFHIATDPSTVAIAIVLIVINLWVIFEERAAYYGLIKS